MTNINIISSNNIIISIFYKIVIFSQGHYPISMVEYHHFYFPLGWIVFVTQVDKVA